MISTERQMAAAMTATTLQNIASIRASSSGAGDHIGGQSTKGADGFGVNSIVEATWTAS